jgi:hypothetical protein
VGTHQEATSVGTFTIVTLKIGSATPTFSVHDGKRIDPHHSRLSGPRCSSAPSENDHGALFGGLRRQAVL